MNKARETSPWVYVGVGCGLLALIAVLGAGSMLFFGWRAAKDFQKQLKDPATRHEKAVEVLGARELPEGYHPWISLSIPLFLEFTVLSDREPSADGEIDGFENKGFAFFRMRHPKGERPIRDYFEGRADFYDLLDQANINLDADEEIDRGTIDRDTDTLYWVAVLGTVDINDRPAEGLNTVVFVECLEPDDRRRVGVWFGPTPEAGSWVDGEFDFTGTMADEATIREFMAHFDPCGG